MMRFFPAAVGLALILVGGFVHGVWTDRWRLSNEPMASAARLADVPRVLGDWETVDEKPLGKDELAVGEIAGFLNRVYVNRRAGKVLGVLCVCGRPGPIGQHPPTVCFSGEGFEQIKRQRAAFPNADGPVAEFWVSDFRRASSTVPESERVYWSWSGDGKWVAADSPRLSFARFPALYKLYVIHRMARPDEPAQDDAAPDFIKLLIPELQKVLFTRS
jgi:hypothetical protein